MIAPELASRFGKNEFPISFELQVDNSCCGYCYAPKTTSSTRSDLVGFEAVRCICDLSKKQHSTALVRLASRMASTICFGGSSRDDIFVKIKGLISDMISKLEAEAEADATEKALRNKELSETNAKKDDKNCTRL